LTGPPAGLGARIEKADDIRDFVTAGNATFTVLSKKTGVWITYRIRKSTKGQIEPVSVVTTRGAGDGWDFVGRIRGDVFTPGSMHREDVRLRGFQWFHRLMTTKVLEQAEVWHMGTCGKCGRPLTVPESIATGLGPVCRRRPSGPVIF